MLALSIDAWSAEVSYPVVSQPLWLACWIDTPDGSSSSASRAVQDAWDIYREELEVVPPDVVLAIRDAVAGSSVFFLGRGMLRIRAVGGRGSGRCIGLVKEVRLMLILLSTL